MKFKSHIEFEDYVSKKLDKFTDDQLANYFDEERYNAFQKLLKDIGYWYGFISGMVFGYALLGGSVDRKSVHAQYEKCVREIDTLEPVMDAVFIRIGES